jgi:UDP-N-acetylglucosamine--N-acetylmuramyl-(pentapeptide) pyrophosphoryl-undecaprenol N-acetylglucosamine transferase
MLEAAVAGIPTLLIEPNAVPGFTNRALAPVVRIAAVAFPEAARFYGSKAHVTGQPVRREFYRVPSKEHVPPFTVLVLGGSQGASAINETVIQALPLLASGGPLLRFIHQTGQHDLKQVQRGYEKHGLTAEVFAFIDDVPQAFARADLIVSRSGATVIAELAAAAKAALLIPFPAATDHHQQENAQVLEAAGGAQVIEQTDVTPELLAKEIVYLLGKPARLVEMERRARTLARPEAAQHIADLIVELVLRS